MQSGAHSTLQKKKKSQLRKGESNIIAGGHARRQGDAILQGWGGREGTPGIPEHCKQRTQHALGLPLPTGTSAPQQTKNASSLGRPPGARKVPKGRQPRRARRQQARAAPEQDKGPARAPGGLPSRRPGPSPPEHPRRPGRARANESGLARGPAAPRAPRPGPGDLPGARPRPAPWQRPGRGPAAQAGPELASRAGRAWDARARSRASRRSAPLFRQAGGGKRTPMLAPTTPGPATPSEGHEKGEEKAQFTCCYRWETSLAAPRMSHGTPGPRRTTTPTSPRATSGSFRVWGRSGSPRNWRAEVPAGYPQKCRSPRPVARVHTRIPRPPRVASSCLLWVRGAMALRAAGLTPLRNLVCVGGKTSGGGKGAGHPVSMGGGTSGCARRQRFPLPPGCTLLGFFLFNSLSTGGPST